jgi:ABC-2 type transport system permease protein
MSRNKLSWKLIKYEILNITGNIITIIFGVIFPIGMTLLFSFALEGAGIPRQELHTMLFLTMAMIIPSATMLMGYGVTLATEIESGAKQRFELFGFSEKTILSAKLIAYMIFLVASFLLYCLVLGLAIDISVPSAWAVITFVIFFFVYGAILFILGHGIATLCGRFGTTFGIVMGIYFALMILGGNMGIMPNELPAGIKQIAMGLPLYYFAIDFQSFWSGQSFNFLPFVLSTVGFFVISALVAFLGVYLTKKGKINKTAKPVYYD